MQKLAEICVRRPVFASVIVLALVVTGFFAWFQLGVDRFPKVEFPWVTITTVLPGAAPEEVETELTEKIEGAVNTISGIEEIMSFSSENVSVVSIQFALDKNGDVAAQEVRDRVNGILSELPVDAEQPLIQKADPEAEPVIGIALAAPASQREISEYADKVLKRRLETIAGVGQVIVVGATPRQINVVVDNAKLASRGLTAADVVGALRTQNVQIPGGKVEQEVDDLTLRTHGRVATPEELGALPATARGDYQVRIRDVATIEDGVAEEETVASVNGKPGIVLVVRKQSGTNTIDVVEAVKERVGELQSELPKGWSLEVVRDQSEFIVAALDAVKEHLILGSLLAAGVVWLFLKKARPTLISAVAIPSSLIGTFAAMRIYDFTLNVITLLALTLAVGIVIDDAVVVLENVYCVMQKKGLSPREAAIEGTREVGLAVMATTLSLIAVFLPVAFMGGIVGRFMYSFGITMAVAIAISLVVSFTLTPMLASRWLTEKDAEHEAPSRWYAAIERNYLKLLDRSMAHRWVVVVATLVVFVSMVPLFMVANKNFLPQDDESQFLVTVRAAEGSSLETTRRIAESVATQIREHKEVKATVVTIGDDVKRTQNLASIYVKLVPVDERTLAQPEVMELVRREVLPRYKELAIRAQVTKVPEFGGGVNAEVIYWVGGPDLDKLEGYSAALIEALRKVPGITDIDTNYIVGKPELGVTVDREKAAGLGVRVQDVAATLNVLVGGQKATDYYENGEAYEVHVRAAEGSRRDANGIGEIEVPSMTGGRVALRNAVAIERGSGPSEVNRLNRRRQIMITANMLPGHSSQAALDALAKAAAELKMDKGYASGVSGVSREQEKTGVAFLMAFVLSIIFMYLILAAQFDSWIHPVTILLSLPMTVPFALLSIVVLDQSLNIFSALGVLVLFGIVKKNSILQVDHTIGLRAEGFDRATAIREANRDRLRPILMTTLAFVAGMFPLVVSSGTGAATNRAIGSVIIAGQTLSLLLTLIGTPVAYSLFDDLAQARIGGRIADAVRTFASRWRGGAVGEAEA
ncbi:MAG: efflux RND transporter permease subunit [Thermoanaerobaculia bacterium]|nr:efflux RND transporter permease subunit [Thermoanaerobaculia bacterium]